MTARSEIEQAAIDYLAAVDATEDVEKVDIDAQIRRDDAYHWLRVTAGFDCGCDESTCPFAAETLGG